MPAFKVSIPHNGFPITCTIFFADIFGGIANPFLMSLGRKPNETTSTSTTNTGHYAAALYYYIISQFIFCGMI